MTPPIKVPGDAALFDQLHALFGIGDYNEDDPKPWFRFRMLEIGKLKALRRKRGLSVGDLMLAAAYCDRKRIRISASWQLVSHISIAKREHREWLAEQLERDIATVVAHERSFPDPDQEWISRLLLARGSLRQDVLNQYREAHHADLPS